MRDGKGRPKMGEQGQGQGAGTSGATTPPTSPPARPSRQTGGGVAAIPSAPHMRPGDQNALCVETDQA